MYRFWFLLVLSLLSGGVQAAPAPGKILLIGDSITQGVGHAVTPATFEQNGNRSWRWEFFKHLVDAGVPFDFVGSMTTNFTNSTADDEQTNAHYPSWRGVEFDRRHEGHWGWRASQIRGTTQGPANGKRGTGNLGLWLNDYTPDTVVVMIGINDLSDPNGTPALLAADVTAIVEQLQASNAAVRVYLCELLHVGPSHSQRSSLNAAVDQYNAVELPAIAAAKSTQESLVSVISMLNPEVSGGDWVPQAGGWDPALMTYDQLHPNGLGEAHVGQRVADAFGLESRWTREPVENGNFEGGLLDQGGVNARPQAWTIFGSPNTSARPKILRDFSCVAEGSAETGTGAVGSSYIIAGAADTGISQITATSITAGRRYQLAVSLYKGSVAAGPGDYAAELRAGGALLAQIPAVKPLQMLTVGSGQQIGKALTEFSTSFAADDFPEAIGLPIEIRLIARHASRYIGFDDVRLSSRAEETAARPLKIFVLTGQSNSLGTLASTAASMLRSAPGSHPAEQNLNVPFFWDNLADGTPAGDAALGDSGGSWLNLGPQHGGYYPENALHWGPEIGFSRMLWDAGYRDFALIKASRGGGGNSLWVKGANDDHMYQKVVATVNAAVAELPEGYTTFEIAGLLYLQGESNQAGEAAEAGSRFSQLVANLQAELPNASNMTAVMGEVGGGASDPRPVTRSQQLALANSRNDIGYASALGTAQHDGSHYTADSQLLLGERMAAEMISTGALEQRPLPAWENVHAWFVADHAAQPASSGAINRWGNLRDGRGTRDLTRSLSAYPVQRPVTAGDGQARKSLNFSDQRNLWASVAEFGTLSGSRSIAVLCRVNRPEDGFLLDGSTSSGRTRIQVRGGQWQAGVSTSTWDTAEVSTTTRDLATWQRHVFTFETLGGATQIRHWIDGHEQAVVVDPQVGSLGGLILGTNGGAPAMFLDAEIAELALYQKALKPAEIATLNEVWLARWGDPTGPAFDVTVRQSAQEIARFGKFPLLQVAIDCPSSEARQLTKLALVLKGESRQVIGQVSLLTTGTNASFDPTAKVLGSIDSPSADELEFAAQVPLVEGTNYFWLVVEAQRWAELGSTIDARIESLEIRGKSTEYIVPNQPDPWGELTIGLTPYKTMVRVKGAHGLNANYRIPGIAADDRGVLHAVYDVRYNFGSDLPGNIDVGYRRSSDGGLTWEPQKLVLDFDASEPGSQGNGVGDPCILWDPATDTLWVAALWSFGNRAYNGSGPGLTPAETGQFVLTKSTDGGDSWSEPINITSSVKIDPDWHLIFNGPGHGLVMRDGTLVFPAQYRDGTIANDKINQVRSCSVYSDDHGQTWKFGSAVPSTNPQTNEMTLCELDDGRLLFSCRTPVGSNGQRAWAHYTPGGTDPLRDGTWEPLYRLPQVPDPVCQGSVIQWKSTRNGHPREMILFSNPATGGRKGMTLRLSLDGGLSWPISRLVDPGSSAYSSICILPDQSIGLLYETGQNHDSLTFVRIEEEWLMNPDLDTDGDGLPDAWELIWGTNPNLADADDDPDGDGMTNAQEFAAGTDPHNAASRLAAGPIELFIDELDFSWSSIPGKSYQIEESINLSDWTPLGSPVVATGPETKVSLADGGTAARRFLRVKVLR